MQEERQMMSRLQTDYTAADKTLTSTYRRLYDETDAVVRPMLAKSQRAWLALRDASAIMHANYARVAAAAHEGALASAIRMYTTQTEMTKARTKELEAIRAEQNAAKKLKSPK